MPDRAAPADLRRLAGLAREYGTPLYAFDLDRVRAQVAGLRAALPEGVGVLYSVKANPLPRICAVLAGLGLGAEVASPGELRAALAAGFGAEQILVSGPYKHPGLLTVPGVRVSVDSVSELAQLADRGTAHALLLRVRPDFAPACGIPMGPVSRFGIPAAELAHAGAILRGSDLDVIGFHVYPGSQNLRAADAVANLRNAYELTVRAAGSTGVDPRVLDLGGGFGIPYGPREPRPLDLGPVGDELARIQSCAPGVDLLLELGRYLVAAAGWYVTRVVAEQHYDGRVGVVVDGGTHHRPDLCGLDLARASFPPLLLGSPAGPGRTTDVTGCLCLPWDVLAEGVTMPAVQAGDLLAFANSGAYGLSAAPHSFISHPPPAQITFDRSRAEHV
ncbi:diaminopimelate decarboxylase [Nonomuraea typhae]|uniref:Diaminopimelate decarboxylase n=1 Tax=Nonomuraea typhae TaxID=2603600 RepID=A0ABW7Z714_9ACTN